MTTEKFLPQYKNAAGELVDIHFDPAVVGLKANPSEADTATLSKISIDGTVYKVAGGGEGGATYSSGTGINVDNTQYTISVDGTIATKTEVQEKINRDEAEETIVAILTAMHLNRYYTGSSVPQASLGQDGDIYLQE